MQYLENIVFHDSEESVWIFFFTFVIRKAVTVQLFLFQPLSWDGKVVWQNHSAVVDRQAGFLGHIKSLLIMSVWLD